MPCFETTDWAIFTEETDSEGLHISCALLHQILHTERDKDNQRLPEPETAAQQRGGWRRKRRRTMKIPLSQETLAIYIYAGISK